MGKFTLITARYTSCSAPETDQSEFLIELLHLIKDDIWQNIFIAKSIIRLTKIESESTADYNAVIYGDDEADGSATKLVIDEQSENHQHHERSEQI